MKRKLILITGGSASGKTHLANELLNIFKGHATLISQDRFYKTKTGKDTNFDEPQAFDFDMQEKVICSLLEGKKTQIPIYDFEKHQDTGFEEVEPAEFIIFEGLFAFYDNRIAKKADFKIFVNTPSDTRLSRRILRDVESRGRTVQSVIDRWLKDVQPSYNKYIKPFKVYADVIIPWHKIKPRALKSVVVTITNLGKDIDELLENI